MLEKYRVYELIISLLMV